MKIKRIPQKIFITVLIAGLIGIAGEIVLKYDMDKLLANYQEIMYEHTTNRNYMADINQMLYRHQAIVASHVVAEDAQKYQVYEEEEKALREELKETLAQFGERMDGGKREQIYHKVYSSFYSYLQNADVALQLSSEGSKGTAAFYITGMMEEFVGKVNTHLVELDELTLSEMDEAKARMEYYMELSRISSIICIVGIVAATVTSLIYCVKITMNLERYKGELEEEVEEQNRALSEHQDKMLELQNNIIIAMANLIENRDGDTGEHVKRTSNYVAMLAETARRNGIYADILTEEYIELLVKAAPLHDVGKIVVPDAILKKPGKLTPEEFEQIKEHATAGGRIVREVLENIEEKAYVDIAAQVAAYHHEKWDGSGYMEGLSGNDIPLCARIMAIADVFDALISKRCYKEAMYIDEAFSIIEESAGTHFDPVLAKLFVGLRPDIERFLQAA